MKDYYEWKAEKEFSQWNDQVPKEALEAKLQGERFFKYALGSFVLSLVSYPVCVQLGSTVLAHMLSILFLAIFGFTVGACFQALRASGVFVAVHYKLPLAVWRELIPLKAEGFTKKVAVARVKSGISSNDEEIVLVEPIEKN